jgi:ATP-dependent exoDNAse (exonuclease V) alpha subunit
MGALHDKHEARLTKQLMFESSSKNVHSKILLSKNERILFKRKDSGLGVDNGDMGTITDINNKHVKTLLDNGKTVQFSKEKYQHFDYAYALTVHKSQGISINNAHVVIDSPYWDRHLSYVAMTRHKEKLNIYANQKVHFGTTALAKNLSKSQKKANFIEKDSHSALATSKKVCLPDIRINQ